MLDVDALSEMMAGVVADEVQKAVAPLQARIAELEAREPVAGPAGEPGEKGEPGANGADGQSGTDGKDGAAGKDAAGIVEALKDSGELVLTLADGRLVRTGIRDGKKGKDGRDGFGFDDMDVCVLDDDRTIELSFKRGEEEKAFTLKWPTVIDRGVWKEGSYSRGDAVTWGGSSWIAQQDDPPGKPDTKDSGWRLSTKRGRDGKDGKDARG